MRWLASFVWNTVLLIVGLYALFFLLALTMAAFK